MDQKASDLFRICDKEDKGFVTKRDMQRMRNLEDGFAGGMDPEQLESVFDTLDSDGNGYLTLEEFSAGFQIFIGVPVGLETIGEIVEVKINRYTFSTIYLEVIIFEIKCSTKEHIFFRSLFSSKKMLMEEVIARSPDTLKVCMVRVFIPTLYIQYTNERNTKTIFMYLRDKYLRRM